MLGAQQPVDLRDEGIDTRCIGRRSGRRLADRLEKPTRIRALVDPCPEIVELMPSQGGGEAAAKGVQVRVLRGLQSAHARLGS
jgi:hypothetical protein